MNKCTIFAANKLSERQKQGKEWEARAGRPEQASKGGRKGRGWQARHLYSLEDVDKEGALNQGGLTAHHSLEGLHVCTYKEGGSRGV